MDPHLKSEEDDYEEFVFDRLRRIACIETAQGEDPLKEIMRRVRRPRFQKFLLEDVGILIAGFLYMDAPAKKAHYLFFSDAKGKGTPDDSARTYYLPYLWRAPQDPEVNPADEPLARKSRLVDLFFVITREQQSPFERDGAPWSGENGSVDYFAEFALHLPRHIDEPQYEVPDERERHIRKVYGFHYVPYGEMVFFTYAWRLLFRRVLRPLEALEAGSDSTRAWEWEAWRQGRFREKSIEAAIQNSILSHSEDWWQPWTVLEAAALTEDKATWSLDDWMSLRLLKQTNEQPELGGAVRPLLAYLEGMLSIHPALAPYASEISALRKEPHQYSVDYCARLDKLLRKVVARLPWTEDAHSEEPEDLGERLLLLHRKARFPIIPYFYWNTLLVQAERAVGGPADDETLRVTHLVVPTWTTVSRDQMFRAPFWRSPSSIADLRAYTNVDCSAECRHLGFAVIGLRPWPELDWTLTAHEPAEFERGASQKARRIFRLIERLSMPQVDAAFFGKIRKEALQAAAKQEGVAELIGTFGHDAQRPARTVGFLLDSEHTSRARVARFLARNLENRLGAYPVIFAIHETAQQREAHLLEDIRSADGWRTLKSIWQEAIVDCLVRVLVDPLWKIIRDRWLGEQAPALLAKCLQCLGPLAEPESGSREDTDYALDAIITAFGPHLNFSCTESVRVPAILQNRVGKTQARAELALLMILSEMVTNAFKHSFVLMRPGQSPSFSLSVLSVQKRADLHIVIGPSEAPRTDFKNNHDMKAVGLRSLRLISEVLGGAARARLLTLAGGAETLPFPDHEMDRLHWTISGVLIRPEDFADG